MATTGALGMARSSVAELLDSDGWTDRELRENFRDIERVNRLLGGTRLTLKALRWLSDPAHWRTPPRILDVGCGSGDIVSAVARWGERHGAAVEILAVDAHPRILALAREGSAPGVAFEQADARDLPYPNGSFDIAMCSMLIHHLPPHEAAQALAEMARVARLGLVVNDLVRSRLALAGAVALGRAMTHNRLSRHDGPISIRRAFTLPELATLMAPIGPRRWRAWQFGLYRVAVAARLNR